MHNNYIVRKSFHTLIAGSILEVHCRSAQKEKVINIHDISGRTVDERACCFGLRSIVHEEAKITHYYMVGT